MPASKREQLIETAMRLFSRDGFRAIGIEKILKECGCAKMTLYNHFSSKDELILAALRRSDEIFRNELRKAVEARAVGPADRLRAVVEIIAEQLESSEFHGCLFRNAAAEFPEDDSPIRVAAAEHKRLMLAYAQELAQQAGASDPKAMAEHLCLLREGAIATRQVAGRTDAGDMIRRAAETLFAHMIA